MIYCILHGVSSIFLVCMPFLLCGEEVPASVFPEAADRRIDTESEESISEMETNPQKDDEDSELLKTQHREIEPEELPLCKLGVYTKKAGLRYSQGAGVGYGHSYSTIEGFFSTDHCEGGWSPFLDLRGHMFNNLRYAANAGVGLRCTTHSIAWGINSYYDYRNTHRFHYNQWGVGLEAIGSFWSVHVNGYLPVGKKRSSYFNLGFIGSPSEPAFAFFQGNQFFITLSGTQALAGRQEFALKGMDARALFRVFERENRIAIDTEIGSYYFQGPHRTYAAGGEAKLTAHVSDYLMFGVSGSYDNLFRQRGQASIGISIPFGAKDVSKNCPQQAPCKISPFFNTQLNGGANRSEIIVLDDPITILATATPGGTKVAINPATGQPYFIVFVNNLSSSDGTYESPFPTIQEALAVAQPNDMIYVYEGDGSAYDVEISLQDAQMLLGSGIPQNVETTEGNIVIPAQSAGSPLLENSMGSTMITAANQNIVSGFNLSVLSAGNTISASNIDSFSFLNNILSTTVATGMNNISISDCSGTLLIQNNQFIIDASDSGSNGIVILDSGSGESLLSIANNTFVNHASRGASLNYSGSSSLSFSIENNTFTAPSGVPGTVAIDITTSNATNLNGSISDSNL